MTYKRIKAEIFFKDSDGNKHIVTSNLDKEKTSASTDLQAELEEARNNLRIEINGHKATQEELDRTKHALNVAMESLIKLGSPMHAPVDIFLKDVQFYVLEARRTQQKINEIMENNND